MRLLIYLTLILSHVCVFSQNSESSNYFKIEGKFKENLKGKIYLYYGKNKIKSKVRDGNFMFEGYIERPKSAYLIYNKLKSSHFYIESGLITLKVKENAKSNSKNNFVNKPHLYINSIAGSLTDELKNDYYKFYTKYKDNLRYNYLLYNYLEEKITEYPNNPLYFEILNDLSRRQKFLNFIQFSTLAQKIDLSHVEEQHKLRLFKNIAKSREYGIGKQFPLVAMVDQYGKEENISKHLGELTLIDFWASWCAPCRRKNPKLRDLYLKYKSKGFNVVGISTDLDTSSWKKAISQDQLEWKNFNTNTLNREMDISSIPYTYLVDKNGTIIGINLSLSELEFHIENKL